MNPEEASEKVQEFYCNLVREISQKGSDLSPLSRVFFNRGLTSLSLAIYDFECAVQFKKDAK